MHGSANLRSSTNVEQLTIEDNAKLYDFYEETYDILFDNYKTINGAHGTTTIGFYIYRLTLNSVNQGQVAAVSMVNFVFVSSIMLLYNKIMRAKEEQL